LSTKTILPLKFSGQQVDPFSPQGDSEIKIFKTKKGVSRLNFQTVTNVGIMFFGTNALGHQITNATKKLPLIVTPME